MACQFTGTFAPPPATPDGPQAGTATIAVATPAASINVGLSGSATVSSIMPQTITGFNPPTTLQEGQVITLSATGGASGNPVVYSIDVSSACPACATITGSQLTAVSAGAVKVDANQAGGAANGNQYAAATQVQAPIAITNTVVASDVPALLMNQIYWSYQSGSFTDGQNPAGGSFAVTQNGLIYVGTTYSNKADIVNASTGALVQSIAMNGGGVFTIDSKNNLYMGHLYSSAVYKIPFVSGAYVALSDLATAPNCTGTDTAICTVANLPSGGMKAIAFDASGNLYMVSVPAAPGVNAIYECNVACQVGGTATLVYSDTTGAVSQIAFDPWGNLFFTDGIYNDASFQNDDKVSSSNLYELPYTAGTGFAANPTLLQTLTDASPGNYDNQLDGVAVTSTGTIYYADQNDGMFAIPNTKTGGPDTAHQYVVSALGAKGMELDANGNEWVVVYHAGGDNLGYALIGDLVTPDAQYDGAPVNAAATVVDNALPCTTGATLAFASSNAEFGATPGTPCSTISAINLQHSGLRLFLSGDHHLHGDQAQLTDRQPHHHRHHQRRRGNCFGHRLRFDHAAGAYLYGAHHNHFHLLARRDDLADGNQRRVQQSCRLHGRCIQHRRGNNLRHHRHRYQLVSNVDRHAGWQHRHRRQRIGRPCQRHLLRRCPAGPVDAHREQVC